MAANNKTIRIIKRAERQFASGQQEISECELKTERQARREIFQTITLWIEEQKQRKKTASLEICSRGTPWPPLGET